jgi:hypothetical protein
VEKAQPQLAHFAAAVPTADVVQAEGGAADWKRRRSINIRDPSADGPDPKRHAPADSAPHDEVQAPRGPILLGTAPAQFEVGLLDPVGDLKRMLGERDRDLSQPAIEQMSSVIATLAREARAVEAQHRVVACLVALREVCVECERPCEYNQTLATVREGSQEAGGEQLWARIRSEAQALTLISSAETGESDVTPGKAAAYFSDAPGPQCAAPGPTPPAPAPVAADVLDDLE